MKYKIGDMFSYSNGTDYLTYVILDDNNILMTSDVNTDIETLTEFESEEEVLEFINGDKCIGNVAKLFELLRERIQE